MKQYNLRLFLLLLCMATYLETTVSDTTMATVLSVIQAASVGHKTTPPAKTPTNKPAATTPPATTPSILPPTKPQQTLAPISVTKSSASGSLGQGSLVTLDYQVVQLPVTAQLSSLSVVADFGSTSSTAIDFDSQTFTTLNTKLQDGHAVVVQVGVTTVDDNLVVYAALVDEDDVSTMFGYAVQQAPAGVVETALSGFTIAYDLAGVSTSQSLSLTAAESLFILNPTVSISQQISSLSMQAVFGSSANPVVSAPVAINPAAVTAINNALQAGDNINVVVTPEYMFGLGDVVMTVSDITKNTALGEASSPITQAQLKSGNFIAYQVNVEYQGVAGTTSFVRGANESVAFQVPTAVSQTLDYYVPANLNVPLVQGQIIESLTISATFSSGASSAGFAFAASDLTAINTAVAKGDIICITVEQSANGSALAAYAIDIRSTNVIATTTNQLTAAQSSLTLDGFKVAYSVLEATGASQPITLAAALGQSVNFGLNFYNYVAVPENISPYTLSGNAYFYEGGTGLQSSQPIQFQEQDLANIMAALNKQHVIILGCGYSLYDKKLVLQAYDNTAKVLLAQQEQASVQGTKGIYIGSLMNIGPTTSHAVLKTNISLPGGDIIVLVPTAVPAIPSFVDGTTPVIDLLYNGNPAQLETINILPDFGEATSDQDWVSINATSLLAGPSIRANIDIINSAQSDMVAINIVYQDPFVVVTVWDMQQQHQITSPIIIPATSTALQSISFAYLYQGQTEIPDTQNMIFDGSDITIFLTSIQAIPLINKYGADQSISAPSSTATLEQLWFSPVFKDGSFAELPLHIYMPEYMTIINDIIGKGEGEVVFTSKIQLTCVRGPNINNKNNTDWDMVVTAWLFTGSAVPPQPLFTQIFPMLTTNKGAYTGSAPWMYTNIVYQFSGQASTSTVANFQPGQQLGINSFSNINVPTTLKALTTMMQSNKASLSSMNWTSAGIAGNPDFLAFNIDPRGGFMFWSNGWGTGANNPVAPDISSITQNGNWQSGMSFVLLGIDPNNMIISDLTTGTPVESFVIAVYDTTSGKLLGTQAVPLSDMTLNGSNTTGSWQNGMSYYAKATSTSTGTAGGTGTYPCVLNITNAGNTPTKPSSLTADAIPTSMNNLVTLLQTRNVKINNPMQWSGTGLSAGSMPIFVNINMGKKGGFMFWSNVWGSGTNYPIAPDISSIVSKGNWATGVSLVFLGLDGNGRIIGDLTQSPPVSFVMVIYDTVSGSLLGSQAIPMSSMTTINAGNINGPWTNAISYGGNATVPAPGGSGSYPCALIITK